jgi:ribonuclease P protein component
MKHGIGKVERFPETFALTRRIQGTFHWTHIRISTLTSGNGTDHAATENAQKIRDSNVSTTANKALLAVVASKKLVDRRAVVRNRAKRRIRPIMLKLTQEWLSSVWTNDTASESLGADLRLHWIVRPKNSAIAATAKELEIDVRRAFEDYIRSWKGSRDTPVHKKEASPFQSREQTRTRAASSLPGEACPH